MKTMSLFCLSFLLFGCLVRSVFAEQNEFGHIPDEFEGGNGHAMGFGYGGVAAAAGSDSIKTNPAMIALEQKYQLVGGYHWPSYGREFYQVGVIDSKTSSVAAGMSFVSHKDTYEPWLKSKTEEEQIQAYYDTPIKHRLLGAVAQTFGKIAFGLGIQYVDYYNEDLNRNKAVTASAGIAGYLTEQLRFGLSIENMANHQVKNISPRMYRVGLAYLAFDGLVTLHGDYRHRDRVAQETPYALAKVGEESGFFSKELNVSEKLLIASFSVRVQNLIRLTGGYGHALDKTKRKLAALGLALVNDNFSLSYGINRPYFSNKKYHQAFNLSYNIVL